MARIHNHPYPSVSFNDLHNPVLIVVDMINGFARKGALADPAIALAAKPIAALLEKTENPAWFICDSHDPDAAEFEAFPPHCLKGDPESEVIDELKLYPSTRIEKNAISALSSPQFEQVLESLQDDQDIIITGCCTDLCVLQLALGLQSWKMQNNRKGLRLIVPVDCVETYEIPGIHPAEFWNEAALANMQANGIQIVSSIE